MKIQIKTQQIEVILAKRNKTKEWLADRLNTTPTYLSELLAGRKCPSAEMRDRLCKVLKGRGILWDDIFQILNSERR